ncbi:scopoletin glucosyltransferase [Ricinus communis]|uniref:UDP-glucosyltransferase, putative n=1 Tax=Ricinus communis TaxID=3988 RepID=B9S1I8_RICCO|nr:scopoletin glucosyltransferase [Ricinus communis]EEF42457.1 UDP-glucosyltransferase, putative [Ricinus communis]|eukprot:XP_002519853.1 scopoletin glucosyltransferase [Ricinus communis]
MSREIFVVPAFGQGHLLPCLELCKHLAASLNFKIVLVIFSDLSSSIPASLRHENPLIEVAQIQSPPQSFSHPFHKMHNDQIQLSLGLESLLSSRTQSLPVCAIVDVLLVMGWTSQVFKKFQVATVGFFTSGACSTAMEYATWKAHPIDLKPGELRLIPGLPEQMALTVSDIKRRPHGGPQGGGGVGGSKKFGPPNPGERPPWVDDTEDSIALIINTCDDLERPFIEYVANEIRKPVWGIGPLLPQKYWESAGSILHDREIRSNRGSTVTEDQVMDWLDSKAERSVIYISFGSELGPTMEEYPHLAAAIEAWTGPFIWVIQPGSGRPGPPGTVKAEEGYFPHGLDKKVGERGLIIRGWAPQLLILSHPSTGGFLSHCGWNSTVEAIGRGVPFLAWPIRGDQYYDAKLVVSYLKMGYMVSDDMSKMITDDNVIQGIHRLMGDDEVKRRADIIRSKFVHGFPASSLLALGAFKDFINQRLA